MSELGDPRYKLKNILDEMSLTKDNGTTAAALLFMYSDADEHYDELFGLYDVLFLFKPWRMVPSRHNQDVPVHYEYLVPVVVVSVNKTGVTGEFMQWKADAQIRALIAASAQPGAGVAIRIIEVKDAHKRIAGATVWESIYTISYET